MTHVPRAITPPRRRGRGARAGLAVALAASALAFVPTTAHAAISTPAAGATVSGNVAINEAQGATSNCVSTNSNVGSRIDVTRLSDNVLVHTASRSGTGSLSTTWPSLDQPRGQYRIESFRRNGQRSGFLNLGCTTQAWASIGSVAVNLDNGAGVALQLPASVVTGEDLTVGVTTTVVGTGVTGQPLGDRTVTVDVPGVGEREVTTDAQGAGSVTVELPDLPAGPLTVSAAVETDDAFTGLTGSATTTLAKRTTATFYRGTSRAQPGGTAVLVGQLIDVTPGSDRFGDAIIDQPLALGFDDDVADASTSASGKAVRTVPVTGESRTVPVSAAYAGNDVYLPSDDSIVFFVGDDAAEVAPIDHGPVGGITRVVDDVLIGLNLGGLGGLLSGTVGQVTGSVQDVLTAVGVSIDDVIAQLGGPESAGWEQALHLLDDQALVDLLDGLLGTVNDEVGRLGDPVDDVLDALLQGLIANPDLGEFIETATFDWRTVFVGPDGQRQVRQFNSLLGVPEPLDVDGDGRADVLANLTLASDFASVGFSNVDDRIEIGLDLTGDPTSIVPRLEIARLPGAPEELPVSVQAILTLPGDDQQYRFGYDTRASDAPEGFRAEVGLADGGAGLQIAARGEAPLTVTGALVAAETPAGAQPGGGPDEGAGLDDEPLAAPAAPAEQRFGVSFSTPPSSARLGIDLGAGGGGQNLAATLETDEPTRIGLELADDSGGAEVFLADGVLDAVDGTLAVSLAGTADDGLAAQLTSAKPMDEISLRARSLTSGRIVDDILLGLTDVPTSIAFELGADGAGDLTTSGPIGVFEAGYGTGREIALLDEPAYLHLISDEEAETQSIALRLPGFEGMALSLGETIGLDLTMAPTPLRAVVDQDGLQLDASILDAPRQLSLGLSAEGEIEVRGSAPIDLVTVNARNDEGLFSGATDVDLRLEDIPSLLRVGIEDEGVVFDTGGEPVGLLELFAHSGTPLATPGAGDGLLLETGPDSLALAGRISGLRGIQAALGSEPDLLLDTVAGNVFDIALREVDGSGAVTSNATATLDRLVPEMRLALVNDGSGALSLNYSASEPTTSLSFDFDGLTGSIGNPLPADLTVCFAGDEACLPSLGIANPDLGSIRFAASEYTTINLSDPVMGLSAQNLRARVLELTGSLDIDNGGDVYLNTAEFGGECGWDGCRYPLQGGRINVDLDGTSLLFEPGVGFDAYDAITNMTVRRLFGQPVGLNGVGGTGEIVCVSATRLDATVRNIPILGSVTLSVKDAICDVPNRTPRPPNPEG